MRKYLFPVAIALGFSTFVGCSNGEDENSETNTNSESEMYQPSELASLMRAMYEDNLKIKADIEKGIVPTTFPEDFYNIHTAKATDPSEINATFKSFADLYLTNMHEITDSDSTTVVKAFNNMVNTCISCHQIYCQGPIPKIKKLYIPE